MIGWVDPGWENFVVRIAVAALEGLPRVATMSSRNGTADPCS